MQAQTVEMIPATDVASAIATLCEANERTVERVRQEERELRGRMIETARQEMRREMIEASAHCYKRGGFPLARLNADEYRDTFAVLAETRTRVFAARLTFDDVEGVYTITALIGRKSYWEPRKLEKEISTPTEAWDFYNRVLDKFYAVEGFSCAVDY